MRDRISSDKVPGTLRRRKVPGTLEPYFRMPNSGPDCSTPRSARLRERRSRMYYEKRQEPEEYCDLAQAAKTVFLKWESRSPALARAHALRHVARLAPVTLEKDALLVGGENPFFFNLLLPALKADRYNRKGRLAPDAKTRRLGEAYMTMAPCFEGHITPGLEYVLGQGMRGLRWRIAEQLENLRQGARHFETAQSARHLGRCYEAMLLSCEAVSAYAARYREECLRLAASTDDADWAGDLRLAADVLSRVPENPAGSFHEALQTYWIVYCLVTLEMGGCSPGGGLGLGRLDQFLYPYYRRDIEGGVLTRPQALELMELFLLGFRHCDYFTAHAIFTPGSQGSLGGVTATGENASNDLTELIMEASLRVQNPAPYISLRLHGQAPERYWQAAANFVAGGLGFPVVNDEVLVPAFLRHGRALADARDYICSCCYENTVPGREAFNPNGTYLNLPLVLELAINKGKSLLTGAALGSGRRHLLATFDDVLKAFRHELHHVCRRIIAWLNKADANHCRDRCYPLMSVFVEDCIAKGRDVCAGGARYNLTGVIVPGLSNVVDALAAIRTVVFERRSATLAKLRATLRADFAGAEALRRELLAAPKWGNGRPEVDTLAAKVTDWLYDEFRAAQNARGGRIQVALYSFVVNHMLGEVVGASPDGRHARQVLNRNLNPAWGASRNGPTAVLRSLSVIDFTKFPNGTALDLRFDPTVVATREGRRAFAGFLRGFVDLKVMQIQITMADTKTLRDAQRHPEKYTDLMVKVAGYSARFIDLTPQEQKEIIARSEQRL